MSDATTASRRVASEQKPELRFATYLAACRAKGAIRQEDRAELLGIPRRTLLRYEKNAVEPRTNVMRRIATTLDLTVDDLWPAA